jgi:hypothetical protein
MIPENNITILDLSDNFMTESDFPKVAKLIDLLPNVRELDISGWELMSSCAKPLKELLLPRLDRVHVLNTELRMASVGRRFFAQLSSDEIGKIIFIKSHGELYDRLWMDMITPEHFPAVVCAHLAYFNVAGSIEVLIDELCKRPVYEPSNDPIDREMFASD